MLCHAVQRGGRFQGRLMQNWPESLSKGFTSLNEQVCGFLKY